MMKVSFNRPPSAGNEHVFLKEALESQKLSGDGAFSKKCEEWFEKAIGAKRTLLVPSCTHGLELAALLIGIQPGDEVILPSYTFVSTANAFVLRGATCVFVDIRPDTNNIDETLIEAAVTSKTKAIIPVHYAGVSCEMDTIMNIATKHGLWVIEDAAQGVGSSYKGRALGTIGHLGVFSFHDTKNYTSGGEGGLLVVNDEALIESAEISREKGTDRSKFLRGQVDKYTWVSVGSSYLPGELQAACLWAQLLIFDQIYEDRMNTWEFYSENLASIGGSIQPMPRPPAECKHNAHMFYLMMPDRNSRDELVEFLRAASIVAPFHYVPLHSSPMGKKHGRFVGAERHTSRVSDCIVRLPLWYGMPSEAQRLVIDAVSAYAKSRPMNV